MIQTGMPVVGRSDAGLAALGTREGPATAGGPGPAAARMTLATCFYIVTGQSSHKNHYI